VVGRPAIRTTDLATRERNAVIARQYLSLARSALVPAGLDPFSLFSLYKNTSKVRRALRLAVFCFTITSAAIVLVPIGAYAQNSAPASAVGRISGTMFDSLAMLPLVGASVWINGTTDMATTDSRGRFELDSVPIGSHILAYSSPSLDSLVFGTQGRPLFQAALRSRHAPDRVANIVCHQQRTL